jgi:uncharacterized protein with NRDE domain
MCLILFALDAHPEYRVVLAANRDEFFARPTLPAAPWAENPRVVGGRDLEQGGTWLAATTESRLAAVTNYRDATRPKTGERSRGLLVSEFVLGRRDPREYVEELLQQANLYDGFNLIVMDRGRGFYCSNRAARIIELGPGVHGLSNHLLDTPWPKVERGKSALARLLGQPRDALVQGLFAALHDAEIAPDDSLPSTGVSLEWERRLSTAFIRSPDYGTRASTVVLIDKVGGLSFIERSFGAGGEALGERVLQLHGSPVDLPLS